MSARLKQFTRKTKKRSIIDEIEGYPAKGNLFFIQQPAKRIIQTLIFT